MNYIFEDSKSENEFSDYLQSDYKLEYLNINDDVFGPLDKCIQEFKNSSSNLMSPSNEQHWPFVGRLCENNYNQFFKFKARNTDDEKDSALDSTSIKNTEIVQDSLADKTRHQNDMLDYKHTQQLEVDQSKMVKIYFELTKEDKNQKDDQIKSQQNIPSPNLEESINKKAKKEVHHRWGRKEDVKMFEKLREFWKEEGLSIESFWSDNFTMTNLHHCIISRLSICFRWKRNVKTMLKRIQRLGKNQTMSVRQSNLLSKLIRDAGDEALNLDEIIHMFPGKTIETLRSHLEK